MNLTSLFHIPHPSLVLAQKRGDCWGGETAWCLQDPGSRVRVQHPPSVAVEALGIFWPLFLLVFFALPSLLSFRYYHYMYVGMSSGFLQLLEALCNFLLFCSSDCIIFVDLYSSSLILYYTISNMMLSSSSENSISLTLLFNC